MSENYFLGILLFAFVVPLVSYCVGYWSGRASMNDLRERYRKQQCTQCGYSLIGLTSRSCPECNAANWRTVHPL